MAEVPVLPLACRPQHYSWGKLGLNSEVAQLLLHSAPQSVIDANTPYAELWMGAHPKADSGILLDQISDKTLGAWIQKNPQSLGTKVQERFKGKLPFLFKVLSVRTALSIQAHPDRELAVRLHTQFPEHYPDANHKPEMAIALTPFTGLCGFRPVSEILDFFSGVPELLALVGPDSVQGLKSSLGDLDQTRAALKTCFSRMMRSDSDLVKTQLQALVHRLSEEDCIECMSCSDNTVRAGLTPKFLDVDTLCEMLDYSPSPAHSKLFPCRRDDQDPHVTLYDPPIDDFSVIRIQVPAELKSYTVAALDSGSILLVISGSARCTSHSDITLKRGSVFFLSANQNLPLEVTSSLELFRACCLL
ncbi:mannose-6-phosphate isomerase isoform X3 [Boleophthalmus pectinirostris]|uniref:mannose-6-phosphate isomerase isoform X3 n=1 Tax=Boleophthalmus pectinirostris TaxID=150288 RepID=UPI00242F6372|nr:mannose-6-phosphate isomerase isoform X3 [Boleophthalmus pectinirostris]